MVGALHELEALRHRAGRVVEALRVGGEVVRWALVAAGGDVERRDRQARRERPGVYTTRDGGRRRERGDPRNGWLTEAPATTAAMPPSDAPARTTFRAPRDRAARTAAARGPSRAGRSGRDPSRSRDRGSRRRGPRRRAQRAAAPPRATRRGSRSTGAPAPRRVAPGRRPPKRCPTSRTPSVVVNHSSLLRTQSCDARSPPASAPGAAIAIAARRSTTAVRISCDDDESTMTCQD